METQTSAGSIPKHLQDLQSFLSKTISEAGRAVVRSSEKDLADMHTDDFYLYLFLYNYFKKKSIAQKKVDAIAIDYSTATILLHKVLLPSFVGGPTSRKYTVLDTATAKRTDYYPLMPQRALREVLAANKVTLEAFSEVVEICNHVDALQGHKKAGFGVVNLLHFVAISITLVSTGGVAENIRMVLDDADLPAAIKFKIIYIWSLVDRVNAHVLSSLCDTLLEQSVRGGYSFVDVSALPPLVMGGGFVGEQRAAVSNVEPRTDVNAAKTTATSSADGNTSSSPHGDQVVVTSTHVDDGISAAYEAKEEESKTVGPSGPRVVCYSADEDADTLVRNEGRVGGDTNGTAAADDDFWVRLSS